MMYSHISEVADTIKKYLFVASELTDDLDRVKLVYDRQCKKFNVIPMGLFLRQLGGNALDLHFNSVGDVGLRALSVPIAVSTPSMTTNLLKPYIS